MKSQEFLLSQTMPSCSNHRSSPEQPRAGNPGRSVPLINWRPTPFSNSYYGYYYLCFANRGKTSLVLFTLFIVFSLIVHLVNTFECYVIFLLYPHSCFPHQFPLKESSAVVFMCILFPSSFLFLSPTSHLCTAFDFWGLKVILAKNNRISNLQYY